MHNVGHVCCLNLLDWTYLAWGPCTRLVPTRISLDVGWLGLSRVELQQSASQPSVNWDCDPVSLASYDPVSCLGSPCISFLSLGHCCLACSSDLSSVQSSLVVMKLTRVCTRFAMPERWGCGLTTWCRWCDAKIKPHPLNDWSLVSQ